MQAIGLARVNCETSDSLATALAPAEYGYYFVIFYTILGAPLGLILMGGIGSGFLLIPVLAWCAITLGHSFLSILRSAWIPIACGTSYLFIQLVLHEESLYQIYIYHFGPWIISLVIVQVLAVHRTGFLHRFALVTVFLGLAMLPFMSISSLGGYERAGLERGVGNSNPNAFGAYFGFCVLYLTIKGYIETRLSYRLTAWLMAGVSLFLAAMSVSRGPIIALAASLLVASRRLLKKGILPFLFLIALLLGLIEIGLFDQVIRAYTLRAGEETGRLRAWPILIEMFVNSPLIGVGASHAVAWVSTEHYVTPHNSFVLIASASGIVPLLLFCAYFFRSGKAALRAKTADPDFMFYVPLVVYTGLIVNTGNMYFMDPWAIVSLAIPVVASVHQMRQDEAQ
jgi:hypothetical protein